MPTIILRHVSKSFPAGSDDASLVSTLSASAEAPDLVALDDLSLTIHDGETLAILGPSGCGKSTLLRVIAGLVVPDSGEVLYDGTPVQEIPMSERGIGMVFQNYALYPHLKTQDNIGFFDIVRRQPERIPERIRYIVDVMGIDVRHLLARKPPTLSGGEQQRVAIAHCLARDPKVFLFDEPLSNLDAKLRTETRIQLKRLLLHYRLTAAYVTHDQQEAVALSDRIALMREGKIEQVGTYQALYTTPRSAFVAQFLGNPPMNLFLGRVTGRAWYGKGFSVEPVRPTFQDGQQVWLGIRPEHVQLVEIGIRARVDTVEPIFPERRQVVHLTLSGQPCVASVPLDVRVRADDTLHVAFPGEDTYLFDYRTGNRIG